MGEQRFEWDESLYAGSAPYYAQGRLPYPPETADVLAEHLNLDGSGRLLDLGCGPGSLTLSLAGLFAEVVGVDADAGMVTEAARRARDAAVRNATWCVLRAERLTAGLGSFRVVTLAQSFHWMDRPRVAAIVKGMLEPGGAWVHIGATTHEGTGAEGTPYPPPPREAIRDLVVRHLGPLRRAGRSVLASGLPPGDEDAIMRRAGYAGPERLAVGGSTVIERSADEVVASVFSLSSAAPHLFGDRLASFELELRNLLDGVSAEGKFCEVTHQVSLSIWRP